MSNHYHSSMMRVLFVISVTMMLLLLQAVVGVSADASWFESGTDAPRRPSTGSIDASSETVADASSSGKYGPNDPHESTQGVEGCEHHVLHGKPPQNITANPADRKLICHDGHYLSLYNTKDKVPEWSAVKMEPALLQKALNVGAKRSEEKKWRPNGALAAREQEHPRPLPIHRRNRRPFSYTEGSLVHPAALDHSRRASLHSHDMTNQAPRVATCERLWQRDIDANVHAWMLHYQRPLHVISGVAHRDRSRPFKLNDVTVPDFFWTVLCDKTKDESVGFIADNARDHCGFSHRRYATVAEVEKLFGSELGLDGCRKTSIHPEHWDFGEEFEHDGTGQDEEEEDD